MKKRKNIKWILVDLTRPAAEIAEELDCDVSLVYRARKRAGIDMPNMSGGKIGNKGGGAREGAGRKPLPEGERNKMTYIRLLPADIAQLKAIAKRRNTNYSELVRQVLQKFIREETQTDAQKTLDQ